MQRYTQRFPALSRRSPSALSFASVSAWDALVTGTKQPKGQLPVTMAQSVALEQLWCSATNERNSSFASHVARWRESADFSALEQSVGVVQGPGAEAAGEDAEGEGLGTGGSGSGVGEAAAVPAAGADVVTGSAAGGGELAREHAPRAAARSSAVRNVEGAWAMAVSVVQPAGAG
jgi:hypothetical protein